MKAVLENIVYPSAVYLFAGPRGIGKYQFASAFAKKILQDEPTDLSILQVEGKARIHPVENIRKLIQEAHLPPYAAKYRVFIIDDADKMPEATANALLKTLEEAPSYNIFLLITESVSAILPTIRSRSSLLRFLPLTNEQIITYLQSQHNTTLEQAELIAAVAGGSLGAAITELLENAQNCRNEIILALKQMPYSFSQLKEKVDELAPYFNDENTSSDTPRRLIDLTVHHLRSQKNIPLLALARMEGAILQAAKSYVKPQVYLLQYFIDLQRELFTNPTAIQ